MSEAPPVTDLGGIPVFLFGAHLPTHFEDTLSCAGCATEDSWTQWPCLYAQGVQNTHGVLTLGEKVLSAFLARRYRQPNTDGSRPGETIFMRTIRLLSRSEPLANRHTLEISPEDWSLDHPLSCAHDVESCAFTFAVRAANPTNSGETTRYFNVEVVQGQLLLLDEMHPVTEPDEPEDECFEDDHLSYLDEDVRQAVAQQAWAGDDEDASIVKGQE